MPQHRPGAEQVIGPYVPAVPLSGFPRSLRYDGPRPETRLMLAVLKEALRCFQNRRHRRDRRSRRLARESEQWFTSDDETWPFAFVPLCEKLGLEPDYVRACIHRWESQWAGDNGGPTAAVAELDVRARRLYRPPAVGHKRRRHG
ncbi:MAG: hypothetical protein AB7N53_12135 [Candidatus Binatia bacterium]